jgi:hypothetical protein
LPRAATPHRGCRRPGEGPSHHHPLTRTRASPCPSSPRPQKGFGPLLEATSNLRKEQEEEGKLAERMHEQRAALAGAERRYAEMNRRLAETRAAIRDDISAEAVLEAARRENSELRNLVRKALPANIEARRETLHKLHRMLNEPARVSGARAGGGGWRAGCGKGCSRPLAHADSDA